MEKYSVKRNRIFYLLLVAITFLSVSDLLAHEGHKHDANVTLPVGINDFPSYHPLAVHFPIVLLIIAAIIQIIALFSENKILHFLVAGLTVFGFIGAYVASSILHPHTVPLSPTATELLESHERFASYTIWLSGLASALKLFTLFKKKKIIEIITAFILLATAISVSMAGHHGSELVHKFGIGPKGNYLEQNHKH
ncbi:MAG: DUF2231 domain-containing protein [Bacteroidota bacterium]